VKFDEKFQFFMILVTSLSTLPYQMVSAFHRDKEYVHQSKNGIKMKRGNCKTHTFFVFKIY